MQALTSPTSLHHLFARGAAAQDALPSGVRPPVQVRQLSSRDLQWLPALADLLIDSVHQGASLGFLAPLSRYAALDYWHSVYARLGQQHSLWIACEGDGHGPLHGAVQLALPTQGNAHHRGEVQRLMVHSQERGRGIASQLIASLECAALKHARKLLVLDVPADSQAEAVYQHLGWQRAGEIPGYGACAEGRLHDTVLMYKQLG
ncbi:GNAT family N-acetyltransferase [Paucibacter sp. APW11]|uniref:GNAT family N-acetyltransferase n=1 Tax=Roseateles aquae TaxID=3077235 RepID=A0ABU3PJ03_9BURK|nr:GNAT family N-acetyltransferase [Paucibacter sp. APW11]MDT9002367.1 GNAT family N-acetyltransferase [Paucibacter sp. APW11]